MLIVFYVLIDEEYNFGPMTSTPTKEKTLKHALTPESKKQTEPSSKKHQISESHTSVSG